jgi:Zn-dependent protease
MRKYPGQAAFISAVGPLLNIAIGAVAFAVVYRVPNLPKEATFALYDIAIINLVLGILNLLPGLHSFKRSDFIYF